LAAVTGLRRGLRLKNLITTLLILGCFLMPLGAQNTPAPNAAQSVPGAAAPPDTEAKKARALLDKMIDALGGNAYLSLASRSEQGRAFSFDRGQAKGLGVEYWSFWQYPDKDRMEVTKRRDIVRVYNGDHGYEITYKGTAAIADKQLEEHLRGRNHSLEVVLRQWLKDPRTLVLYAGPSMVENRMTEQVTLLNARDESVTIAIAADTYLPLRKSFTYRDPLDNLKTEEADTYGSYRPEQGMMTAHSIVHTRNGEVASQRFLTKVEYNPPLSSSLFEAKVSYDPQSQKGKQ
jgi:hypothetical protein